MSIGYTAILKIKRLETDADKLGFRLAYPKHRSSTDEDTVALIPKDADSVPLYARDTEFWSGSTTEVEAFLRGIMWSRQYDEMLAVSSTTLREKKEQGVRNRQLMETIKKSAKNVTSIALQSGQILL